MSKVRRMGHREDAALLALVTNRSSGESTAALISEVMGCAGDATAVWEARNPANLFGGGDDAGLQRAEAEIDGWVRDGYEYVSILNARYPQRLRAVHDAPPFIFYRGNLDAAARGGMSVVGSRDVSDGGVQRAAEIAQFLVSEGIPVISGLARGVDAAAHEATLRAGGIPVGVIATGIGATYTPAASRDLHESVASAGVLISQFAPTAHAMKHTFLQRNATMSGLGLATIVIEAGELSGARAQARLAMQHGRPVILTDHVVSSTQWGRALADGSRRNVHVVASLREAKDAIARVRAMTTFDHLDQVLAAAQ